MQTPGRELAPGEIAEPVGPINENVLQKSSDGDGRR